MPVQFKIAITKEIIAHCKNCGTGDEVHRIENNCAIAFALADIFPKVHVSNVFIFPFGTNGNKENDIKIPMPPVAQQFIKLFDGFRFTPRLRLLLPEFDFTIDVPDEVIEQINIDDVRALIEAAGPCHKQVPLSTINGLLEANLI